MTVASDNVDVDPIFGADKMQPNTAAGSRNVIKTQRGPLEGFMAYAATVTSTQRAKVKATAKNPGPTPKMSVVGTESVADDIRVVTLILSRPGARREGCEGGTHLDDGLERFIHISASMCVCTSTRPCQ